VTGSVAAVACVLKGQVCGESWHNSLSLVTRQSPRHLSVNISAELVTDEQMITLQWEYILGSLI